MVDRIFADFVPGNRACCIDKITNYRSTLDSMEKSKFFSHIV